MKQKIKYIVSAKLWFDKINGNTYHSVSIINAYNELIYCSGITYGYGEQYRHTALDYLIKTKAIKEEDRFNHELIRTIVCFISFEVSRKKDLDLTRFEV